MATMVMMIQVDRGKMKICDFGGARAVAGQQYTMESSQNFTVQWAAPELLSAQKRKASSLSTVIE